MNMKIKESWDSVHHSDVLNCLSSLSGDEVFTSPNLVNRILDIFPEEIWMDDSVKFLDPSSKSGVFLREITKRLQIGLKNKIPDESERLSHILTNQVFGIATTDLTARISRRTVYCSQYADGEKSIHTFDDNQGNIKFKDVPHFFSDGKRCKYCGANKQFYDKKNSQEDYAYTFIHIDNIMEIFDMKFDVIIGNPPYQLRVGNKTGNKAKAIAIYHKFIEQAIRLNPKYISMITPSRWMSRSAAGVPDEFVDKMLNDKRIRSCHDFLSSKECFPSLKSPIKGGVNYFLWDKTYQGECEYYIYKNRDNFETRKQFLDNLNTGVVIRNFTASDIIKKIVDIDGRYFENTAENFSGLVSPKDFFTNKEKLTSSWDKYSENESKEKHIKCYLNKLIHKKDFAWISDEDIAKNHSSIALNKVYIAAASGSGDDDQVLSQPFLGEKNSACSQTYLVVGYHPTLHNFSEEQCKNIISYIETRFFRYLVNIKKNTQNGPRGVYEFVPLQDFTKTYTDEMLYKKYKLTKDQIKEIEKIRPLN